MRLDKKNLNTNAGFTLLEILLAVFIIGIVSTVILSRVPSIELYNERVESDTLKSHLRYAQSRAMNTNKNWGIQFLSPSHYRMYSVEEAGTTYRFIPGRESAVSITLTELKMQANQTVEFDEMGSPGASDISVRTSNGVELILVTAETGFFN